MEQRDKLFAGIVKENQGAIYRICLAYLYDKSHAADLYQEILVQVWKSMDNYKGAAAMSTWIYRIAVNTAITYNTKYSKNKHDELPEYINLPEEGLQPVLEKEAQLNQLSIAISKLEEHDRLLISLVLEDLSYKEIAEITGSNTNNIGVRITRIKARLLKLMNEKTDDYGL